MDLSGKSQLTLHSWCNVIPKKILVFFTSRKLHHLRKVIMKSFRLYSLCLIFIVFVLFMAFQLIVLSQRKTCKYSDASQCAVDILFSWFLFLLCFVILFVSFIFKYLSVFWIEKKFRLWDYISKIRLQFLKLICLPYIWSFVWVLQNGYTKSCWFKIRVTCIESAFWFWSTSADVF